MFYPATRKSNGACQGIHGKIDAFIKFTIKLSEPISKLVESKTS